MRVTGCNYLVDLNPKVDRLRILLEKPARNGSREKVRMLLEPAVLKDVKEGRAFCKADFDAPFQNTLSLDQIAETFGITRPRVQQLEARARRKIEKERLALGDFVVESPDDEEDSV